MMNGDDDSPSVQAYFNQQEDRNEPQPYLGLNSNDHGTNNVHNETGNVENQIHQSTVDNGQLPVPEAEQPNILHPQLVESDQPHLPAGQPDFTYNDLHSDTALHSYSQPLSNAVSNYVPAVPNVSVSDNMGLHSTSPADEPMEGFQQPAQQVPSSSMNETPAVSQNPLPPMGYMEQNQNYFQPNFQEQMSDLKGENNADYGEVLQQDNDEPEAQRQQYSVLATSNSTSLKPSMNNAQSYFAPAAEMESSRSIRGESENRDSGSRDNSSRRARAEMITGVLAATRPPQRAVNEIERSTRPPLDRTRHRPDMRDPNTRAPIVPHEQDPTPFNKVPAQVEPQSNLESMRQMGQSNQSLQSAGRLNANLRQSPMQTTSPGMMTSSKNSVSEGITPLQFTQHQQPQTFNHQPGNHIYSHSRSHSATHLANSYNRTSPATLSHPMSQSQTLPQIDPAQQSTLHPTSSAPQVSQQQPMSSQQIMQMSPHNNHQMNMNLPHMQPINSQMHQNFQTAGHPQYSPYNQYNQYNQPFQQPMNGIHPMQAQMNQSYSHDSFAAPHPNRPGSAQEPERPSRPGSAISMHSAYGTQPQNGYQRQFHQPQINPYGAYNHFGAYGMPPPHYPAPGMYGFPDPYMPPHMRIPPWEMHRYMHRSASMYEPEDDTGSVHSHRSNSKRNRKENIYKDLYKNFEINNFQDDDQSVDENYPFESTLEQEGRKTPPKYNTPHCIVRFSPTGLLVKVLGTRPDCGQTSLMEIHSLEHATQCSEMAIQLHLFPGPLSKASTHKGDVLRYCSTKAEEAGLDLSIPDRMSYSLLWNLLSLLVRSNGSSEGHEYAELLLGGSFEQRIASGMDEIDASIVEDKSQINDSQDSVKNPQTGRGYADGEKINRFRELIQYGRQKDALEWAMKTSLWGHALMLSYKMDSTKHQQVMSRFAASMDLSDPLQTAYQFLSGRQPAAVTQIPDEDITSWRQHLSMILSNSSQNSNMTKTVYQRSINSLADTLWNKGLLYASQFCYVLGNHQRSFGYFNRKSSKIVLIGGDHTLDFDDFLSLAAIQMTEIYEYAISLSQSSNLPSFQPIKFIYATWLLDHGLCQQAFAYFEQIALDIIKAPEIYHPTLILRLSDLAFRIQLFGQQRSSFTDEAESPEWLVNLNTVAEQVMYGAITPENPSFIRERKDSVLSHSKRNFQQQIQTLQAAPTSSQKLNLSRSNLVFSPGLSVTDSEDVSAPQTERSEPELRIQSSLSSAAEAQQQQAPQWPNNKYQNNDFETPALQFEGNTYGQNTMFLPAEGTNKLPDVQLQAKTHQQEKIPTNPLVQSTQLIAQNAQNNQPQGVMSAPPIGKAAPNDVPFGANQNNNYTNPQTSSRSRHNTERNWNDTSRSRKDTERSDVYKTDGTEKPSEHRPVYNYASNNSYPANANSTPTVIPPTMPPSQNEYQHSFTSTSHAIGAPPIQAPDMSSFTAQLPPTSLSNPVSKSATTFPEPFPPSTMTRTSPPPSSHPSLGMPPPMPTAAPVASVTTHHHSQFRPHMQAPMMQNAPLTSQPVTSFTSQQNAQPHTETGTDNETSKANSKKENKAGLLSKLAAKYLPNSITGEVHLPDDRNKSIYYDEDKGKWVDKNAPPEEENKPLPPPMIPMSQPGNQSVNSLAPASNVPGGGGGGGFRRSGRGPNRRNMYKDAGVMGGKIKNSLTNNPMMTSPSFGTIPSAGMFQPAFQPSTENEARNSNQAEASKQNNHSAHNGEVQNTHDQNAAPPNFFNPSQFGTGVPTIPPPMPTS